MARSEDPTTYSQAWQDVQQSYAAHDPNAQHPQSGLGAPQQPVAHDAGGHAPQYHNPYEQAAQDPALVAGQGYAQPEAYPALDPQPAGYAPVTEQNYAAPDPYAGAGHMGQAPSQPYQPDAIAAEAAPQAYQPAAASYDPAPAQPDGLRYADPVTQPTQGYAGEPQAHAQTYDAQSYQDPAQGYAQAEPQTQQPTYSEFAPAQDPYAQPAQYGSVPTQLGAETHGHHEPMVAGAGFGQVPQAQEPSLGAAPQASHYQDFSAQPQFADTQPQFADPQAQDFGHAQLGGQPAGHDAGVLDTSLFAQPDELTQTGGLAGAAMAGGHDFGFQTQPAAGQQDFGHLTADPQAGYDQRFQPQPQGYDQRFEQPVQGQYDGGLVGDISPQLGHDGAYAHPGEDQGFDMPPVVAEQQIESSRSRRGLIVVGALVAAVGIGGGLGFAYKYSNDSARTASGTPPTIKANRTAAKQAPKKLTGQSSFSSDSFAKRLETNRAARKSTTRVVSREEPLAGNGVSLRSSTSGQTNAGGTRVTTLQNGQTGTRANVPGVRRVKTLKVNPDGTFAVPSTRTTVAGDDALSLSGVSLGAIPKARTVTAKRIDVAKAVQAARKTPATLPKLAAKVPQPRPAPTPKAVARLQPAAATAGGGGLGFVVQVSARRSRIDALAAFADLQQRYTGALSAKQPDIQEVNLGGTRGKWYRVRIGPPGSKNAAYNLCNRLKKSGLKDCLIKAY